MANVPVNKELYNRVKAEAKKKFKTWPSAYGSAWLVKTYKKRGGKYRKSSKQLGGMSDAGLKSMQSFYKDMQKNAYNPDLMQDSLNELNYLQRFNPRETYLKKIKSGTGETLYKGPGLFSQDEYVLDKDINIQTDFGPQGQPRYENIYGLDQPGFATTDNLGYGDDVPEGTQYMMDAYGNDYSVRPPEMKTGGIPERYKNMGFTKVGAKKKSTRSGKKWMVLAKKGDKYKVVHGGDNKMQDFKQHGSAKRKKRFWDRMGGRDSAKAKDPFSPLYWHKRFGTWKEGGEFQPHMMYNPQTGKGFMAQEEKDHLRMSDMGYLHENEMQEGGQFNYDPNNPMPQFEMGNSILDKMKRETMRKGGQPCYECGGMYSEGGTNNPGFRALPPDVQQKIKANMNAGGMTPFNVDPSYYGERLEKFVGNIRNTASENIFPDMKEEAMAMPQARYGMPMAQDGIGVVNDPSAGLIDAPLYIYDPDGNRVDESDLTYGSAVFDSFGNLLGGYYDDGKMHPRRPGKTYSVPNNPDQTVTIDEFNNLNYDFPEVGSAQDTPTEAIEESGPIYLYDGDGNPITNINDVAPGTELYGPPAGGSANLGTYRGNGQIEQTIGNPEFGTTPVVRDLASTYPEFNASYPDLEVGTETTQASARSTGPTIAQRFEDATGLNWQEAGRRGLTDGSTAANQELINRVEAGEPIDDIQAGMQAAMPELTQEQLDAMALATGMPIMRPGDTTTDEVITTNNNTVDSQVADVVSPEVDPVIPETIEDEVVDQDMDEGIDAPISQNQMMDEEEVEEEGVDYNQGTQGMYTDPKTGMVMNVPQQYYNQQAPPANAQTGMYPQYGSPYLQRARYKYGPLGRNLRKVDLQYGMPGQMMPGVGVSADDALSNELIAGMEQAGAPRSDIRKAKRAKNKKTRQDRRQGKRFNKFVDKYGSPERLVDSMQEGSIRGTDRNALTRAMERRGIKPSAVEGQRFEGYNLIERPGGEYEYRPQAMYGGANPYVSMYKQGGEYYMDQDTINMILAMGGDVEFLD